MIIALLPLNPSIFKKYNLVIIRLSVGPKNYCLIHKLMLIQINVGLHNVLRRNTCTTCTCMHVAVHS